VFNYVDVEDDKWKTPCAMWFLHLDVPDTLTANVDEDCCFAFTISGNDNYLCIASKWHCILDARVLMKTIRNGCINGDRGNELSTGP